MKAKIRARLRRWPDAEPMTAAVGHVEYAAQNAACRYIRQARDRSHAA
jgi:hypothetical protein